jgi:hypothetical protein
MVEKATHQPKKGNLLVESPTKAPVFPLEKLRLQRGETLTMSSEAPAQTSASSRSSDTDDRSL